MNNSNINFQNTSRQLIDDERVCVYIEYLNGWGIPELAERWLVCEKTIRRIIKTIDEDENWKRKPYKEREGKFDDRTMRHAMLLLTTPEGSSLREVAEKLKSMSLPAPSKSTLQRYYCKMNIKCYKMVRGPLLTSKQKQARLEFAYKYANSPVRFWRHVLFTDETPVCLIYVPANHYIYVHTGMPKNERKKRQKLPDVKHAKYIMIWGSFCYHGLGWICPVKTKINAQVYQQILGGAGMKSFEYFYGSDPNAIFQQDYAPPHTAKSTVSYFAERKINVLDWPGNSPDLNPIENLWSIWKENIYNLVKCNSEQEFIQQIWDVWNQLDMDTKDTIHNLVDSMSSRLQKVIESHGETIDD